MPRILLCGIVAVAGCEPQGTPAEPETPATPTTPAGNAWSWFHWKDYIDAEKGTAAWMTPFPGVPHLLSFCNWANAVFPEGIPNSPLGSNSGSDWKRDEWVQWATQNGTIDTRRQRKNGNSRTRRVAFAAGDGSSRNVSGTGGRNQQPGSRNSIRKR
ncbi:MAG: hypothetical protein LBH00_10985 [Planctomycetaceae bacterium]|nr:hypothetical protein [Planctomycetaceae bacterium]